MPAHDLSILGLITNASLIVQLIMLMLLTASVWSWAIIFNKLKLFKAAKKEQRDFEERFIVSGDLSSLYKECDVQASTGMQLIFVTGFKEFVRLKKQGLERGAVLEGSNRAMRVVISREVESLETWLPFLATVGSTSPYVGLFGTVWGIMNSFRALGQANNASLAMVAPGISEALIATAMGLFAAIPGVVFYNRFVTETDRLVAKYETFQEEFETILHRQ